MLENLSLSRGLQLGLDALGLQSPTAVQNAAIPAALEGRDLLISSATGSGKTLAYLVPSVQRVLDSQSARDAGTLVLVLVPTRELARQIAGHFAALTRHTRLTSGVITGGNSYKYQQAILRKNPECLIATPGRLVEFLEDGSADLASLQTLVVDEADRMLDMGFQDDVLAVIAACNPARQTLLVSATLKHAGVGHIAQGFLSDPLEITVGDQRRPHANIKQQVILADDKNHKQKLLGELLTEPAAGKTLVFCNTRAQADQLGGYVRYLRLGVGVLHGDMTQEERNHVVSLFAQGSIKILAASDVAGRGLDVKDIDRVINFDLPRSSDDYIHRIGRTGRADRNGLAVSFIAANDWNQMVTIERFLGTPFERRVIKGLKARFKGPKKLKSNGKAAGSKNKKTQTADKKTSRHRNKKNVGKRRAKHGAPTVDSNPEIGSDGRGPLKRKLAR